MPVVGQEERDAVQLGKTGWRAASRIKLFFTMLLRRYLRRPFAFYLVFLLLFAIVPAFLFSLIILKRSVDQQERVVAALLTASTGSVTRIAEREIDGMVTTLRVVSTLKLVDETTLESFYHNAATALAGTGTYLALVDENLRQLINTRVPFGTPLPPVANTAAISAAMRDDRPFVSGVFFGTTSRKWVYSIYLPIRTAAGKPYLLALTQDATSMAKAVNRQTLSPGWNAALIDGDGRVIVSSDGAYEPGGLFFLDTGALLPPGVSEQRSGGVTYRIVKEVSPQTGWRVVAWAKRADVDASAIWSYFWLSIGGIVSATFAVVSSLAIGRLLTKGVRLLAQDARRLGAGMPISARQHMISEVETVSSALAEASGARAKAENEIRFLMREVAHRSKNQLTVIQSMLNQSANAAASTVDFADGFRKRIAGLARSTDLMIASAAQGVDLRELAQNQLQPFAPGDARRLILTGPPFRLDTQASQTLGMALHELATNATKYGAFANDAGIVTLSWSLDGPMLLLVWRETGASLSADALASVRKGFGTIVLERMMRMALDATLVRTLHADGIEWRMTIPGEKLAASLKDPAE